MAIDPIEHAISNWKNENYICGYTLYVYNSCKGWDKEEISIQLKESIIRNFKLIKVGVIFITLSQFLSDLKEMDRTIEESTKLINETNNKKSLYLKSAMEHKNNIENG